MPDRVSDYLKWSNLQVRPAPLADERHPSVIYRPAGPFNSRGEQMLPHALWFDFRFHIRVMVEHDVRVAYNPFYFINIKEIVADLLDLIKTEKLKPFDEFEDYAIWNGGRLLAVIHCHKDLRAKHIEKTVQLFNESGDLLNAGTVFDGWPIREEWIANGKGSLDYLDPKEHPERDHSPICSSTISVKTG